MFEAWAEDASRVRAYRFGLHTADFLVCANCGVYVAAVCQTARGDRATINVNALDDRAAFDPMPRPVDYEGEAKDARLARRAARWTPAVLHFEPGKTVS
jgi:hypothetical protein